MERTEFVTMEIEMKNLQKEPANGGDSSKSFWGGTLISSLIEHSTQEVGTVEELPRLYSTCAFHGNIHV